MLKSYMVKLILSDLFRYTGETSSKAFLKLFFNNIYFRFQVYLRLSNSKLKLVSIASLLLKARLGGKVNVQLSRNVPIGYGLYIPHGNVVINSTARIGNNCSLLQFVSIGAIHRGKAAEIGDNVYVGPNANIVGAVCVGDNSVIGAGAVVVKDIDNNSVVAGSPAKVINEVQYINKYCEYLFPESLAGEFNKQ